MQVTNRTWSSRTVQSPHNGLYISFIALNFFKRKMKTFCVRAQVSFPDKIILLIKPLFCLFPPPPSVIYTDCGVPVDKTFITD